MPNLSDAPRVLEIQTSFIAVDELMQAIYSFLTVSQVLKLRLTSRQFNEAALQTQEDLVDEHRAAAAIRNLPIVYDMENEAWRVDLPVPSIMAFYMQTYTFRVLLQENVSDQLTASSEVRHLLVLIDTLKTPARRTQLFPLIQQAGYTATDLCNRPIATIEVLSVLYALNDALLPNCSHAGINKETAELRELFRTYYDPTSDITQQKCIQKAIRKRINNLLIISEYKKFKFYKSKIPTAIKWSIGVLLYASPILALSIGIIYANIFIGSLALPVGLTIAVTLLMYALLIACAVPCAIGTIFLINHFYERYEKTQRLNPFYETVNLESHYEKAEPHLKELRTLVSEMGMFKNKAILDEDESRQKLSHRIQASAS